MSRPPRLCRRSLRLLALLLALAAPAAPAQWPLPVDLDPKVETLLSPLSAMPRIQRAEERLPVELLPGSAAAEGAEAWLRPSFGSLRPDIALGLPVAAEAGVTSALWPGRTVDRYHYRLPADLLPDLYDLEVAVAPTGALSRFLGNDHQRRAVGIVKDYPQRPRVVVIADPSVGDPRPVQEAVTDAVGRSEVNEAVLLLRRSLGNPLDPAGRWPALAQVIEEVNLVRPDFVIVTGDLTYLAHARALPYEYEDAWALLDRLEVPAFLSPGNHDLYAVDDLLGAETAELVDGSYLWGQYFGPLYYATDVGPKLHLVSLNTFEWPRLDPFPPEDEFDTRAAGQVSAEQYAWAAQDLQAWRARSPQGTAVSFAHHDPSWMQRRHAWTGEHRLELRDLFAATGVGVHFSGHTHEDRVARYYRGDVVETNGRPHVEGHVVRSLHLLKRDGSLDLAPSQAELGAILREPAHGPLFVSTTTAASGLVGDIWGLGGYWGWRLADLVDRDGRGGLDPADFGYPVTDEYLAVRAERPENWTAEHAQYGLFSYPSFELDQRYASGEESDGRPYAEAVLSSRLLTNLEVLPRLRLPLAADESVEALGGAVERVRRLDGMAEVWVRATVPAGETLALRVRPAKDGGTPPVDPPPNPEPPPAAGDGEGGSGSGAGLALLLLPALWRRRVGPSVG